jgi:hypothetical protein
MPRKKKEVLEEIERRINGNSLLTDEEKEQTRKRAAEHVLEARKKKATDEYFSAVVKEEEREYEPTEVIEDFYVELPEYTPFIKINNIAYFHGLVYEVPYSKARAMADIQWSAWQHQNEIDGKSRHGDLVRRPRNMALSPTNPNGVTTTQNIRASH